MHHDEHTITTQSYDMPIAQSADGRLYNDDFEEDVAGFLTMSYEDIDTTEIDFKILTRYEEILKNDPAYTTLTTDQYVERLTQLCEPYPDMCTKIVRKHDYTPRQYYMYTLFTIHLITQIDKNIKIDVPPLRDTIASIKFVQNTREPRGRA